MKPNGKKTWTDPLIEIANSRKTKPRKKLWGVLRAIARSKDMPPKRILDEIDRVNRKYHLAWTIVPPELERPALLSVDDYDVKEGMMDKPILLLSSEDGRPIPPGEMAKAISDDFLRHLTIPPRPLLKIMVDERGRKILYRVDDENPEKWVMVRFKNGEPFEVQEEHETKGVNSVTGLPESEVEVFDFQYQLEKYKRPHLGSWGPLRTYDQYLFELIPRLRDPDWVAALRICPGCGNLLMSSARWENKFCGDRCKKRNWARGNRGTRVYCVAEERRITLLECRQTQNDLPYDECETCPNQPKKGGRHGSMR